MCEVQGVVEDNIRWIVRAGMMSFWHDNWIGSGPLCHRVEVFQNQQVADFVTGGEWNAQLLSQVLQPELVQLVTAIAAPTLQGEDRMVWMLTPTREFSIASALSLIRSQANRSLGTTCIWHRFLPFTVSFFMLRLLSDRLPLLEQLRRFGVQGPFRCACCANPQEERLNHVFYTGEAARQVWKAFEVPDGRNSRICSARHMAIAWWICPAPNRYLAFVYRLLPSLICWELWRARTSALMQGGRSEGGVVVDWTLSRVRDLLHLQFPSLSWAHGSWGDLYADLAGLSGGGGLLRDSQGGFLLGFSCFLGITTSLHAELQALLYGVKLCVDWGYRELHLEVDSLILVQIISAELACPWRLQVELDDLLQHQSLFRSITHCFREANKPSDRLAKMGADRGRDVLFESFAELPPMARGDIRMDRSGFPSFRRRIM
nr:uncharacterized protein LOC113689142 [Coffea arabica]